MSVGDSLRVKSDNLVIDVLYEYLNDDKEFKLSNNQSINKGMLTFHEMMKNIIDSSEIYPSEKKQEYFNLDDFLGHEKFQSYDRFISFLKKKCKKHNTCIRYQCNLLQTQDELFEDWNVQAIIEIDNKGDIVNEYFINGYLEIELDLAEEITDFYLISCTRQFALSSKTDDEGDFLLREVHQIVTDYIFISDYSDEEIDDLDEDTLLDIQANISFDVEEIIVEKIKAHIKNIKSKRLSDYFV